MVPDEGEITPLQAIRSYRWLIEGREPFIGLPPNAHRHDADALAEFVKVSPWLPPRLKQVAKHPDA